MIWNDYYCEMQLIEFWIISGLTIADSLYITHDHIPSVLTIKWNSPQRQGRPCSTHTYHHIYIILKSKNFHIFSHRQLYNPMSELSVEGTMNNICFPSGSPHNPSLNDLQRTIPWSNTLIVYSLMKMIVMLGCWW